MGPLSGIEGGGTFDQHLFPVGQMPVCLHTLLPGRLPFPLFSCLLVMRNVLVFWSCVAERANDVNIYFGPRHPSSFKGENSKDQHQKKMSGSPFLALQSISRCCIRIFRTIRPQTGMNQFGKPERQRGKRQTNKQTIALDYWIH